MASAVMCTALLQVLPVVHDLAVSEVKAKTQQHQLQMLSVDPLMLTRIDPLQDLGLPRRLPVCMTICLGCSGKAAL